MNLASRAVLWLSHKPMIPAIEQAEKELQRDKDDLKRLKKRYPGYDFVPTDSRKISEAQVQRVPKTEFTDLELAVLTLVERGMDKEWTSRMAVDSLRGVYPRLPEKDDAAMNAVGAALIELMSAGKILRSHEGAGRNPHRYKALAKEEEVAPEEATP